MFILNVTSILIAVTFKYQLPRFTIHKNEICYFKSNTFQAQCTFTTVTLLKCRLFFIIFNNSTCLFFMMFPIIKFKLIIQQVVSYTPGSSLILGSLLFLITLSSQVHECYLPKCSPFVYFPEALKSLLLFSNAFYNLVFTPPLLFSSPFFFLLRPLRMLPQYKTQMASFHLLPFLPS